MTKRKPSKTSRKGRDAYYEPRDSDVSQNNRRAIFLETVRALEPKVMEELSGLPLRFFLDAGFERLGARNSLEVWELLKSENWHRIRHAGAPFLWLRRTLWEWGERWKLDQEWCLKAAYYTLSDWAADSGLAERSWSLMIYVGGYTVIPIPGEGKFSFEGRGWELTRFHTREQYVDFIRKSFEEALKVYCDEIEKAAPDYGYVVVPPTKFSRKPHLPYEWLVRYRVQGWTLYKINKEYYPKSSADNRARIKEGINEAAAGVGFPPFEFSP